MIRAAKIPAADNTDTKSKSSQDEQNKLVELDCRIPEGISDEENAEQESLWVAKTHDDETAKDCKEPEKLG